MNFPKSFRLSIKGDFAFLTCNSRKKGSISRQCNEQKQIRCEFVLIGENEDEKSYTCTRDGFGVTEVHEERTCEHETRRRLAAWSTVARAEF